MFYNVLQSGVALLWQKVTTQSRHQLLLLLFSRETAARCFESRRLRL